MALSTDLDNGFKKERALTIPSFDTPSANKEDLSSFISRLNDKSSSTAILPSFVLDLISLITFKGAAFEGTPLIPFAKVFSILAASVNKSYAATVVPLGIADSAFLNNSFEISNGFFPPLNPVANIVRIEAPV